MLILLIFQDHVDAKNVDEVIESQWALNFSATMKNEMSTTLLCIAVVTKRNISALYSQTSSHYAAMFIIKTTYSKYLFVFCNIPTLYYMNI